MKTILKILAIGFLVTFIPGCMEEYISPLTDLESVYGEATSLSTDKIKEKSDKLPKITGFVQIEWKGGKGGDKGNQPDEMLAFVGFEGFEGTDKKQVRGDFIYQVTTPDTIVHREIIASLSGVYIDHVQNKSWLVGTVISDTKGCAGNGHGGHDSGCQGGSCGGHDPGGHDGGCSGDDGTDHTDGGCSGTDHTDGGCSDSDHTDGGCSNPDHTDTDHTSGGCTDTDHTDGGCSNPDHTDTDHTSGGCTDTDHTDGGCSNPDHTDTDHTSGGCTDTDHTDGGCSNPDHSDSDHTDGGCSGSGGSGGSSGDHGSGGDSGMGNALKGKNCRVGQIIAIKGHDGGTPGVNGDGITWKWFSSEGSFVPSIFNTMDWPHLCRKTILDGNIKIHKP